MEYRLRAMELWFQHLPGSLLLEQERAALEECFSKNNSGLHCLQIGGPSDLCLVKSAHYLHKVYLSSQFAKVSHASRIQSCLEELPIRSNTIDVVVLVHLLEFSESPQQLLKEINRILIPEGQLILLTFNPYSLWGIARLKYKKQGFPWSGQFYSMNRIKSWIKEGGCSVIFTKTLCFRPVPHNAHQCKRWSFLDAFGSKCLPSFGAASLLVARKRRTGMTPIRANWNHRKLKIGGQVIEPTTYR